MAPQNKRANVSKAQAPAKKIKVQHSDEADDAFAVQLAPIFAALSASPAHSAVCDMLRAALPHCLGDATMERHSFQTRMLDLTAKALKSLEETANTDLGEAQANAEKLRTEATLARANLEVAQSVADAKKAESDTKGAQVEKLNNEVKAVKLEKQGEEQKKETFLASKATLIGEQEAFENVMTEMWEPLKASKFLPQQHRKKEKCIAELVEKLTPLALDASLVEALQVALKLKVVERTAFTERALSFSEEAMERHRAHFVERLAETGSEEAACEKAVAEADAKLAVVKGEQSKEDKEYDELQNSWAELESKAQEATTAAKAADAEAEASLEDVEAQKSELEAALALSTTFVTLRDPPAPEPVAEEVAEEAAEVLQPSPMEMEAPAAVAVA